MVVLALAGYKGSGKDTAAEFLAKERNYCRYAFADKLKDNVADQYAIDRSWLDDPKMKECAILTRPVVSTDRFTRNVITFMAKEFASESGAKYDHAVFNAETNQLVGIRANTKEKTPLFWSPRALAILEGSSKRSVNPNYWVDIVVGQIYTNHNVSAENVVITDLRYGSEVTRLKEAFGNKLVTARVVRGESTSQDPSERDLDDHDFDYYLYNQGSKDDLYAAVNKLADYCRLMG